AAEWQRAGKQRDLLWSGRQLAELDERALEGIASRERAFVAESRRARRTVRWVRRGLVAAALLAVVGTYAGTRLVHRRDVNRAVAAELTAADARLDAAHVAMTSRAAARTAAFAAWDRKATADAERTWKTMLDQTAVARVGLADAAAALERALLRDADRTDVRARYGDVLLERALLADDDGRREEYNELVARLAAYDADGARRARLAAPAHLTLTVTPEARISAGGFGPDEVGSHPRSTSPFGVTDLSGNVWEWVSSSLVSEQVVARGGSYYFAGNTARVTNRELPEASYRDLTVGLRVCASSPAAIVE
nr:formylglycine-generating enzyme family protein [Myxococcota bacterium]